MFGSSKTSNSDKEAPTSKHFVQSPVISLPKGGGAIRGIDEKFKVSPVTGTASMSIPIATTPGRSGFGPELMLSYDSGAGNGPFGFSWSLGLPSISRKTDKGLPRYLDQEESDVFIISGAEDLVPVLIDDGEGQNRHSQVRIIDGTSYFVYRYRPRVEGLFSRIERWVNQASGESHWRSISQDNITTLYGKDNHSRVYDPDDPNPEHPTRVFCWLICQSYDDKGNAILYQYREEDSANVSLEQLHEKNRTIRSRSANRYLKSIKYGNNTPNRDENWLATDPALLPEETWMFEVIFDYGEGHFQEVSQDETALEERRLRLVEAQSSASQPWPARQDSFSTYRAGFDLRTYRLCRRVLMFHHFPNELQTDNYLVRATHFNYIETPVNTLMTSVVQSGYLRQEDNIYQERSFPPVEFEYSRAEIQSDLHVIDRESLVNLPVGLSDSLYQWIDLDGEGLNGILTEQGTGWYYKRNLSPTTHLTENGGEQAAGFGSLEQVIKKPSLGALNHINHQFLDLSGNGRLDLVLFDGSTPGFFERTDDEQWSPFHAFDSLPSIDWNNPNLRLVDLTGDGNADILMTEDDTFVWFQSLTEAGFSSFETIHQFFDEEQGPRMVFDDGSQSFYLADMSGDGLIDLVHIWNGGVCYWPNLGYGRFGAKVTMDNAAWFDSPDIFEQQRIRLADVDGSGNTDILYIEHNRVAVYFNQAGNSWAPPQFIDVFPKIDNVSDVTVIDLLGNGTACLVWSSPLAGSVNRQMAYIDLMGGQKPNLLIGSRNNLGVETRVHYAPSTRFYLDDKASGCPWITRLPFPVHVVERTEVFDHISRNRFVSRYRYHHGYFDGVEREFRGFGMVEQIDTEEFAALNQTGDFPAGVNIEESSHVPPVLTKSWFHTGVFMGRDRVSNFFAGLLDDRDTGEYYREPQLQEDDAEARRRLLPDTVMPTGLTIEGEREAARSLKGAMLRQEVYALDDNELSAHPYVVIEQNFTIQQLQAHGPNRHAVFYSHPRETINFHYERNPMDPRVSHSCVLAVDVYGNVLRSAAVGYPRRSANETTLPEDQDRQHQVLITYMENEFTNAVEDDDSYRTPLPSEDRSYEVHGLNLPDNQLRFSFNQLQETAVSGVEIPYHASPTPGILEKRLLEQSRTLYRPDDLGSSQGDSLALLPLGVLEPLALVGESYMFALSPDHLQRLFGDRVTDNILSDEAGYVHFNDDDNWWIPSGRIFLSPGEGDAADQELNTAQQHFFMPVRFTDPFGQNSVVLYDDYDLMLLEMRDPLNNRTTAGERGETGSVTPQINYRLLQPEFMTAPNGNRSGAAFDTLGLVAGTAVSGKLGENVGESLEDFQASFQPELSQMEIDSFFADPGGPAAQSLLGSATSRVIYDETQFQHFGQPPFAAVITRETHTSDLEDGQVPLLQIRISYSDGFGREIQQKIQAEPGLVPRRDDEGAITLGPDGQPQMTEEPINPRWVGSGWTVFNNKGMPVRQYEPFFTDLPQFEFDIRIGVSPILFYDPVGRVVATLHPNHTWEKVIFDPWRQASHDVNDTVLMDPAEDPQVGEFFRRLFPEEYLPTWHALRTDPAHAEEALARWPNAQQRQDENSAASKTAAHASTPSIVHFDTLGRPFLSIEDNGPGGQYQTRSELDIESSPLRIVDDRGNVVMTYQFAADDDLPVPGYDAAGRQLYEMSMDAGERRMLPDISGKPVRSWDSRNHIFRFTYDELQRPLAVFVQQGNDLEQLVTLNLYGEKHPRAELINLRSQVYQVYDQAGLLTHAGFHPETGVEEAYDFKGNLLRSSIRLARNYRDTVDWSSLESFLTDAVLNLPALETAAAPHLEEDLFASALRYDALNRLVVMTTPDNSRTLPTYNPANLLEQMAVQLPGEDQAVLFVSNIDYNALGQRSSITYATADETNFTTTYAYEQDTLRLSRLRTVRSRDNRSLQDLNYTYDPVGNITSIRDNAQQIVFFSNAQIEPHNDYVYDAVYRLVRAEGREHAAQNNFQRDGNNFNPVIGIPFPNNPQALQRYLEEYQYDGVGNILRVTHAGGGALRWTRCYQYEQTSNRLLGTSGAGEFEEQPCPAHFVLGPESALTQRYSYDPHGNMTAMPHLTLMRWDFFDMLRATSRQTVNAGLPETTYYVYNAAGERVRKVTDRFQSDPDQEPMCREERIYLGGFEIYRRFTSDGDTVALERETLHVMDDQQRIAQIDTRTQGSDETPGQSRRFQLSSHTSSVVLELDEQANIISYEEYHPFGTSAYRAGRSIAEVSLNMHRYTGQENDEENGFYYYGARYYACWLGRWTSADPVGIEDGVNQFAYARLNPINFIDPTGTSATGPPTEAEWSSYYERADVHNTEVDTWHGEVAMVDALRVNELNIDVRLEAQREFLVAREEGLWSEWIDLMSREYLAEIQQIREEMHEHGGPEFMNLSGRTSLRVEGAIKLFSGITLMLLPTGTSQGIGADFFQAGSRQIISAEPSDTVMRGGTRLFSEGVLSESPRVAEIHGDIAETLIPAAAGAIQLGRSMGGPTAIQLQEREVGRFMKQGFSEKNARYLAKPYSGEGEHFMPKRWNKNRTWIPKGYLNSPFNVNKGWPGINQGRFYEFHFKVDAKFKGTSLPGRIRGQGWSGKRIGLQKLNTPARLWYSSPRPFKLGIVGMGAAGYAISQSGSD